MSHANTCISIQYFQDEWQRDAAITERHGQSASDRPAFPSGLLDQRRQEKRDERPGEGAVRVQCKEPDHALGTRC